MMRRAIAAAVAVLVMAPASALACPVCFGASDGPMLQGSNMGILALLLVTLSMLAAFGVFFLHLVRRAATSGDPRVAPMAQPFDGGRAQ